MNLASHKKEFDYLGLKKEGAERTKGVRTIMGILETYTDSFTHGIFSEIVQKFDGKLNVKDCVAVITPQRIYLFTRDYNFIETRKICDVKEIIMIKANPSMLAFCMANNTAYLL
jgi:hypothetical protein